MLRRVSSCAFGLLLLLAVPAPARAVTPGVDKEIKGKIVKVDIATRSVTVDSDEEGKKDWKIGDDTAIVHTNGKEAKDGINVAWLVAGTEVKLTVPDRGKTIKEIRCVTAARTDAVKTDAAKEKDKEKEKDKSKDAADAKGKEKEKSKSAKDAAAESDKDSKSAHSKDKAEASSESGTFEARGTKAKVLKVDADAGTAQVETESGKKVTLTIGEGVKFLGPRGGVSTERIKDDRFVVGNEIRFYMEGKELKEIHLPYRPRTDGEGHGKDEGTPPKKEKDGKEKEKGVKDGK